jgi:tellurium resistance protein TerD
MTMLKAITLQQGENISLNKIDPLINNIIINISWNRKTDNDTEYDIDSSAFLLNANKKVRNDADFIFYNQASSIDNSIELISQDVENQAFIINLHRIATDIQTISFILTIHEAKQRQQNFSQLDAIVIAIKTNNTVLLEYPLQQSTDETALILGDLYRYNNEWKFRAVGQGFFNGLDILARGFGVEIDAMQAEETSQESKPIEKPPTPTVLRYIEAIKPYINNFQERAIYAKRSSINESGTRLLIDEVLKLLGYKAVIDIKTEQKIPKRRTRADYILSVDGKNVLVIEAKRINEPLSETHVSQVSAYAYYSGIDFAVVTNGIHWQLYYIEPKKLKKYKTHFVFAIDLLAYNDKVGEHLFSISRYGIIENSFINLKNKLHALNSISDFIFHDEVIERLTSLVNHHHPDYVLTTEDVLHYLETRLSE